MNNYYFTESKWYGPLENGIDFNNDDEAKEYYLSLPSGDSLIPEFAGMVKEENKDFKWEIHCDEEFGCTCSIVGLDSEKCSHPYKVAVPIAEEKQVWDLSTVEGLAGKHAHDWEIANGVDMHPKTASYNGFIAGYEARKSETETTDGSKVSAITDESLFIGKDWAKKFDQFVYPSKTEFLPGPNEYKNWIIENIINPLKSQIAGYRVVTKEIIKRRDELIALQTPVAEKILSWQEEVIAREEEGKQTFSEEKNQRRYPLPKLIKSLAYATEHISPGKKFVEFAETATEAERWMHNELANAFVAGWEAKTEYLRRLSNP